MRRSLLFCAATALLVGNVNGTYTNDASPGMADEFDRCGMPPLMGAKLEVTTLPDFKCVGAMAGQIVSCAVPPPKATAMSKLRKLLTYVGDDTPGQPDANDLECTVNGKTFVGGYKLMEGANDFTVKSGRPGTDGKPCNTLSKITCDAAPAEKCPEQDANDLLALNYALTLEHLEATFYAEGQAKFSAADFKAAGYEQEIYDRFTLIKEHEAAHVTALDSAITTRGGKAAKACTYKFGLTDVASYIATSKILEATGVMAYDGAISALADPGLQQVAASIATVEARHSAFLNGLTKTSPFPDATDMPKTPAEIAEAVKPFLDSCPQDLVLPTVRPGGAKFSDSVELVSQATMPKSGTYTAEAAANDGVAANYALTLEHLENNFYIQGLAKFSAADFSAAGFDKNVYDNIVLVGAHETAHVNALTTLINSRVANGAVPMCEYNFGLTDVKSFVATARVLENTGVSAYDGAINTIADTGVSVIAATIATVEARHASYLNNLLKESPFPDIVDPTSTPAEIVTKVTPFIKSCPYTIVAPLVATKASCPSKDSSKPNTGASEQSTAAPASGESSSTDDANKNGSNGRDANGNLLAGEGSSSASSVGASFLTLVMAAFAIKMA